MSRINVYATDDYEGTKTLAGWFEADSADTYAEDTIWDGSNHISVATGSQWNHEMLYHTSGGRWVLHDWSQWQGSTPSYRFVSDQVAREWLLTNKHDDAVEKHFEPVEPERGPGRPEIGPAINIRLGNDLLAIVDNAAKLRGVSRSAIIRDTLTDALTG